MRSTEFQRGVLAVIVGNRSEESHRGGGGLAPNAGDEAARVPPFHDPLPGSDSFGITQPRVVAASLLDPGLISTIPPG